MSNSYLNKLQRKVAATVRTIEDRGLSSLARVVFAELLLGFHNTMDGRCDPSASTIGERIGRSEKSVRNAIVELEATGAVRTRQRRRHAPEYIFPHLEAPQDRKISSDLEAQDRQFFVPRPEEMQPQDRKVSSDKPVKRTNKENLERGIRLPDDWQPSPIDFDFAIKFGLSQRQAIAEAEKFRDYWQTKVGKEGIKANWAAAWRNWIRNTEKYGASKDRPQRAAEWSAIDWNDHVSRYRANGTWLSVLGPAPDRSGCKAPLEVLRRQGFILPEVASA
jgi:hypothetical protein